MKRFCRLVSTGIALAVLLAASPASAPSFDPQIKEQTQSYLEARKSFHTKLTRKGPAPGKWEPPKSAEGVEQMEFASGDFHLKAWVGRPAADGKSKHPAVLFLHGGFNFDRSDWMMSQPYRDAGFIVLTPILRGEDGQEGSYSAFYDEVDDVLAAAALLRTLPDVDREHIFISGHSGGGIMAIFASMLSKDFRAAASFSGTPDLLLLHRLGVTPPEVTPFDTTDPREFEVRSPLAYAASLNCPIRIYYGSEEPWFAPASRRTAEIAKSKGLNAEAVQVDGDHSSSVPEGMKQSIVFFKKFL